MSSSEHTSARYRETTTTLSSGPCACSCAFCQNQYLRTTGLSASSGTWEGQLAALSSSLRDRDGEINKLKQQLSSLASAQEEADSLRWKVKTLTDKCQQCEQMAARVQEQVNLKDGALQRALRSEEDLKAKIAWLESNVVHNYQRLEGESRNMKSELEGVRAEKAQRVEALQRADADLRKVKAELSHAEKHAAELHNQLCRVRDEATRSENEMKKRMEEEQKRWAEERGRLQNEVAALREALRKAQGEAAMEKTAKEKALQDQTKMRTEMNELMERLRRMKDDAEAERAKLEAELQRQRDICMQRQQQENMKLKELESAVARTTEQINSLSGQLTGKEDEVRSLQQQLKDLHDQLMRLKALHEREASAPVAARHQKEIDLLQQQLRDLWAQLNESKRQHEAETTQRMAAEAAAQKASLEMDNLLKQLTGLKGTLADEQQKAATAIGSRDNTITVLRADIGDLQSHMQQDKLYMQSLLDDKEKETGALKGHLSGLQQDLGGARSLIKELEAELERLRSALQAANTRLGQKEAELGAANASLADAQHRLGLEQQTSHQLTAERDRLAAQAEELQREIQALRNRLAQLAVEKDAEIKSQVSTCQQMQQQLGMDRDHWKRIAQEKEVLLNKAMAEIEQLKREIERLRQHSARSDEALAAKEADLLRLQAAIDDLQRQLAAAQKAVADRDSEISRLRAKIAELERELDRQKKMAEDMLAGKDAEIARLQGMLAELQRRMAAEVEQWQRVAEERGAQAAQLQRELEQERGRWQELLAARDAEISSLKDQLADLRSRLGAAEAFAADREAEVNRLQQQVANLEHQLAMRDQQIADQANELRSLTSRISDLQRALDAAQKSNSDKDAEIHRLRAQLQELQVAFAAERDAARQLRDERERMKASLAELQDALNRENARATQAEREAQQLRDQLAVSQARLRQVELEKAEEQKAAQAQIADLKATLAEAQRRLAEAQVQAEQTIRELRDQIAALQAQLQDEKRRAAAAVEEAVEKGRHALDAVVKCASDQVAYMAGECARTIDNDPLTAAKNLGNLDSLRQCLPDPLSSSMRTMRMRLQTVFEEVAKLARDNAALSEEAGKVPGLQDQAVRLQSELSGAKSDISSLKQTLSWKESELQEAKDRAAATEAELRRQLQSAQDEVRALREYMADSHNTLGAIPGMGGSVVSASHARLGPDLKDLAVRVASHFRGLASKLQDAEGEIERLKAMLRDMQNELQRLRQLLDAEKAVSAAARKEAADLKAELQVMISAHSAQVDELMQELARLKQANQRKVDEAQAMFQRQREDMERKLQRALEAARLLARYAIPANQTIKQLTTQKDLLSKMAAGYYKQLNTTRLALEELHSRYCPSSRYTASTRRICGHSRSVGARLFRVAARTVIAARRLWRLKAGYSLESSLKDFGPALKIGGSVIRMLPELPRDTDGALLDMITVSANGRGSQHSAAAAVGNILEMGPYSLTVARGLTADFGLSTHASQWKVSIDDVVRGIAALLDAAKNKMMHTERETAALRHKLGMAEATKAAADQRLRDADSKVTMLMKRIQEEEANARNKSADEAARLSDRIKALQDQLGAAEDHARAAKRQAQQTQEDLERELKVADELRHKLMECEATQAVKVGGAAPCAVSQHSLNEMQSQIQLTGRLNARLQAVSDTQRKLHEQYEDMTPVKPAQRFAYEDAASDDDYVSDGRSAGLRRKMDMAKEGLAAKKAELQGLLKEKGRHDGMLRSELQEARDKDVFVTPRVTPKTGRDYATYTTDSSYDFGSGTKVHRNEWS
mmetsp:Transcript_33651/g.95181  ORF Transcript_33651/g.95181 Transcript_33651/m.95181 type:complete len:1784 (+) Transcript_33651:223-5574(+)|eukprot:CAMPEP_0117679782 /NCGR_PEP_ID=MMETSP0804-20121206/17994_1 /TAXON_ID=1074897 /ORGANISM="Tetraselmis astigmatica, Strain CCMP880" /LENGTH=1783 /DNA_ID=CAMNT_0005489219 /DNA_START=134 /DNA_END=5485 /DNA_ORIENTATION=-